MGEKHVVRFEPVGIEIEVDEDQTILRAAFEQGIMLAHGCKEGQCASCKAFVLDGEPIGRSVEEIEAQLGEPLSEVIEVGVTVGLPGEVTSNATEATDRGVRWQAPFGADPVEMEASSEDTRTMTVVGITAALSCAVLLLAYWLVRRSVRKSAG